MKQFLFNAFREALGEAVKEIVRELKPQRDFDADVLTLTRRFVGSVSLEDVPLTKDQVEKFDNVVGANYDDAIKPVLDAMVRRQERFTSAEADGVRQGDFGRGTINGVELFREKCEEARGAYQRKLEQEKRSADS